MAEPTDRPVGYAKVDDGTLVEFVKTDRPPVGYLPVYQASPPNWDPELMATTGEWIDEILPDRINRRPDFIFLPVEAAADKIRDRKKSQVRLLQVKRMGLVLPAVETPEMGELLVEIMRSILPAALSLSPKIRYVRDTVQAANAAVQHLDSLTEIAPLRAYNPRSDPQWPGPSE